MPPIRELLKNTAVQIALVVVALIAVGSITYYLIESAPPKVTYAAVTRGDITEDVTATGVVSPVQNPTLSFEMGGQVTQVNVQSGQKVSAGTVLATLDTGILSANLAAAQAKLAELEAGPRSTDIAGQQTAVQTAQTALGNTYTNFPQTLRTSLTQAEGSVYSLDSLFDRSNPNTPALTFPTTNNTSKILADNDRAQLSQLFIKWQNDVSAASASSSPQQLQALAAESQANLNQVSTYLNDLTTALNDAETGPSWTTAQEAAALTEVSTARSTVSGLVTTLSTGAQSIISNQLALQSAQDSLNQTLAGAKPEDIEAQQAAVAAASAQLRQDEIIAPFSGTVASVSIKSGDVVSPNTQAISLVPSGNFEVDVYVPENQMTELAVGNKVDVTLDAYGTGRVFPASVGTIETSPSIDPNSAGDTSGGYKVTIVFDTADAAIANGMHANVTIHAGSAQNILLVPKAAVITNGSQQFVLKQSSSGPVQTPVTVGLENDTQAEILSGLSVGDKVSAVGSQ